MHLYGGVGGWRNRCIMLIMTTKYVHIKSTTVYAPRRNWDSPNPFLASKCSARHTSLRVGGWGESQFRRGAYTVVLFKCTYFVIMTLDPSWRQTLRLPPPGIEPGSSASQAGTLPKELSRQLIPMLRIRDFYPRSRILIFSHPGSWIQNSNKREG